MFYNRSKFGKVLTKNKFAQFFWDTVYRPLIATHIIHELSIGTTFTFDYFEWHVKVISAYVVIPTSNISEIIYDTPTETEIANMKSHESFQVIRPSMILAIFQGL